MQEVTLIIHNKVGLHARPAALFVQTANKFEADIKVENLSGNPSPVNAKSILSLLTAGVECNDRIRVSADGEDEAEAMKALKELVGNNFGEE